MRPVGGGPLLLGGFGDLPREFFLILSTSTMCISCFLCQIDDFWPYFNCLVKFFAQKDISWCARNLFLYKIFFQTVTILYVSLTLFYLHVKAGFTHVSDSSKTHVLKRYTNVFSVEYPFKMYKLFRFGRPHLLVDRQTYTNDMSMKPDGLSNHDGWKLPCSCFLTLNECWGNRKF